MPRFSLTVNGRAVLTSELDATYGRERVMDLVELQRYAFELEDAEDDTEYRVGLGDELAEAEAEDGHDDVGRRRRREVHWEDRQWFESARGFVVLRVQSRPADGDDVWTSRLRLLLYVRPTKIGEERYRGMASALAGLSAGLLFDVLGKASRGAVARRNQGRSPVQPPHLELKAIERVWRDVASPLASISKEPVVRLTRYLAQGQCWGAERLPAAALSQLALRGVDPRHPSSARPFTALRPRLRESADTQEHRSIRGFLDLLVSRLADCSRAVDNHVAAIESERPYRERGGRPGESLYETIDLPRLNRLRAAQRRASTISDQIQLAARGPFLGRVSPDRSFPQTPVFEHVVPYRRLRRSASRYLRTSLAVIDLGADARSKSTSRMYEQWVFLQLANAFLAAGLDGSATEQLLQQVEGARRFVVDLPRDANVRLSAPDGRLVRIRYEPHVFGREIALARGDSVFKGVSGPSPWSPDVLIEVLGSEVNGERRLESAIVVDAKYTKRILEDHWHTEKYHQIRSVATQKPIVHQVWLAHPALGEGIRPRDSAVLWTENGPNRPWDEVLDGVITVMPPECADEDAEDRLASQPVVSAVMRDFALGLCRQLGLVT